MRTPVLEIFSDAGVQDRASSGPINEESSEVDLQSRRGDP